MGACCGKADPPLPDILVKFQYQKDVLAKDAIYDMLCKNAFVGAEEDEPTTERKCKGIMDEDRLCLYLETCRAFFRSINKVNGPLGNREIFYSFMLSGKVWRIHASHYDHCVESKTCSKYANEGLDLWYIVMLTTYKHNVWDPDKSVGRDSIMYRDIISRRAVIKKIAPVVETTAAPQLLFEDSIELEPLPREKRPIQWKNYNPKTNQIGNGNSSGDDDDDNNFNDNHESFLTVAPPKKGKTKQALLSG